MLKNPFLFNISWLSILALVAYLLSANIFWHIDATENWKHIIVGLFYSTLILLINEIVLLFRDVKEYGILKGVYYRSEWFEKIQRGHRAEDLSSSEKIQLSNSGKTVINSTSYQKFDYGFGQPWRVELKYLFKGVYRGNAIYPKYWSNRNDQTNVKISLHLRSDLNTGSGTYTYEERNDIGTYSFQINDKNLNEIIVRYQNIIPSGLAEGYEIWKKINP